MTQYLKHPAIFGTWRDAIILGGSLVCSGVLLAQNKTPFPVIPISQLPSAPHAVQSPQFPTVSAAKAQPLIFDGGAANAVSDHSWLKSYEIRPGVRRISLEEAQDQAQAASTPLVRLGQLSVETAKQHRLGAQSDYFPKLGGTLSNFHFNKFMGETLSVRNRTVGFPLAGKDQTFVALTVTQPITPLFKVKQAVNLARADENIARAKAGIPVETAANLEENYYKLLVAQRQLAAAKAAAYNLQSLRLVASSPASPAEASAEQLVDAGNRLAAELARVQELSAVLNQQLGWPLETELELIPPPPHYEEISLQEATDKAAATNAEVVEAEQNVVKARAATTLAKLEYVPDVAVMGIYAYNDNALPLLPRDFSGLGIMASFNVFDFGKREHTIKERRSQLEMAQIAVQLTKAKAAAAVKSSYFEMQRARQLSELYRQFDSAIQLRRTSHGDDANDFTAAWAKTEAAMFEADLAYRQALSKLKNLMGEQ